MVEKPGGGRKRAGKAAWTLKERSFGTFSSSSWWYFGTEWYRLNRCIFQWDENTQKWSEAYRLSVFTLRKSHFTLLYMMQKKKKKDKRWGCIYRDLRYRVHAETLLIQCCFTSTETMKLIRERELRTATSGLSHSSWALLKLVVEVMLNVLRCQLTY